MTEDVRPAGRWREWVPPLVMAGLIFAASSVPGPETSRGGVPHLDKLVHAVIYAVLAALLTRALVRGTRLTAGWAAVLAAVLATLYGVTDEWHQSFTPRRDPSGADLVADALGSVAGAAVVWVRYARARGRAQEDQDDTVRGTELSRDRSADR